MKEILSKVSLTAFCIGYLFFCGVLYLLAYWSTFDFDITNYIELLDIPKSFVFPLATGIGISSLGFLIQAIARSIDKIEKDENINKKLNENLKQVPTKTLLLRIISDYNFWAIGILFVCYLSYKPRREWVFAISGLTIMIFSSATSLRHPFILKFFPNFGLRLLAAFTIFFIPVFSFTDGKLNAIDIWKNRKYFQVTRVSFRKNETIGVNLVYNKLLGKLGTTLFLSDSLNSRIITVNTEAVQAIEYTFKEENH
jgi:hypothetical protein